MLSYTFVPWSEGVVFASGQGKGLVPSMTQALNPDQPFADQLAKLARASALLEDSAHRLRQLEEALQAADAQNGELREELQRTLDRAEQAEALLVFAARQVRDLAGC